MATHRGAREGSIYQRKSDGRWVGAITVPGKGQMYVYGKTKEEARRKLRDALRKQEEGLPLTAARRTVGQFLDHWLEETVQPSVRTRTYASYSQMVRLHIKPGLGHHQLAQLTPQDVQAFLKLKSETKSRKSDATLSPRTVQYLRAILRQALGQALMWDLVPRNVAALATPPRSERHEAQTLSPEQAISLLGTAHGDRLEALYVVTLVTGIRQAEALGLRWSDLDLQANTLTLRKQLQRVNGQYELNAPKTVGSRRALPLLPRTVDALREHRDRQLFEKQSAGSGWLNEHDLVFTTASGAPLNARVVVSRFKALLKRAALPDARFHDLRHSCASLLAYLNVHPSVIMAILGHSTSRLTMDLYTHVDPMLLCDAADKMQGLLSGRR
jgi:integrase